MTHPPDPPRSGLVTESTTKANAAAAGGGIGGGLGSGLAAWVVYWIWRDTTVPIGIEDALLAAAITAVISGAGAWISTYYAPPNRLIPPKPRP